MAAKFQTHQIFTEHCVFESEIQHLENREELAGWVSCQQNGFKAVVIVIYGLEPEAERRPKGSKIAGKSGRMFFPAAAPFEQPDIEMQPLKNISKKQLGEECASARAAPQPPR